MRILQVGMSYNHGGVESYIINYYKALSKYGVQMDFICMYDTIACETDIKGLGGKIHYVPNIKKNTNQYKKEFRKIISENDYDIIYVNMLSAANIVPLKIASKMGCKRIIAHSHNTGTVGIIRKTLHLINKKQIVRYATDLFACSDNAARWMFGEENYSQAYIVHNGIDVERFLYSSDSEEKTKKDLGLLDDTFVIGHVGRFEYQKNHEFIIDVFRDLQKREPNSVLLLIGDGVLKKEIENKVQKYCISDKVFFLGIRDDVPQLLCTVDAFLFPSFFEGLSVTLVEAQCAGVPVICSEEIDEKSRIGNLFEQLRLNSPIEQWVDALLKYRYRQKSEAYNDMIKKQIKEKGYDIAVESDKLWRVLMKK